MLKLKRLQNRPVLEPIQDHRWESRAVFNAAAVYTQGLIHLLYRASNNKFSSAGEQPDPEQKYSSSLGYAVSEDGLSFNRMIRPVFQGENRQEGWGVEDPRISRIDDHFYMLYTGFGGRTWKDYRICLAVSDNLISWQRRGVVLDEPNKDAALFPQKLAGRFALLHRREPHIWVAYSSDLKQWTDHQIIMKTRPGNWDEKKIGIAGPPLQLNEGWLLIYHGVDQDYVYRLGYAVLDLKDPGRIIYRQQEPLLEPELDWEVQGLVPNVVFSCGAVEKEDQFIVYYGGADTVIGAAVLDKGELKYELSKYS